MASIAFGDVGSWEELNDLIAGLQTWVGQQEGAGRWTSVPYSTSLFRASAGTWTVPQGLCDYMYTVNQDVMQLRFSVVGTTTASMGNQLFVRLPDGWKTRDNAFFGLCYWSDGTTSSIGVVFGGTDSSRRFIRILRDVLPVSTNWPNAASLNLGFSVTLAVVRE